MQIITSQRIYFLIALTTAAVSAFTLASLFGRHPYLELATHFRLQYALAATACVILLVVFHSWKLLPLALCCAVVNLAFILPYYAASRPPAASNAVHLKLMHANVLGGNKDYAALIAVVEEERPDVLVLQEFTEKWEEQLRYPLGSQYPYSKLAPRQGGSGMALYSRYPLEGAEVLTLDASSHLAILARVNIDGIPLTVLALHPPTPMRTDKFANRNEQFSRAASIMRETQGAKVLIGDLNTTMWSPYFTDLIADSGLSNARQGFGLMPSWPVPLPTPFQIPIDHCLVGGGVAVDSIRTGGRTGSDHRPLIVEVSVERGAVPAGR
jgi:endonuclease/exonuclease/phosphatase (EEP) superfamily protein YafD